MAADMDELAVATIRTLSMDAVQKAESGHPGTPMALAPVAYELWANHLRFDPSDPIWPNRDRFVLSNGHASMLLWSLLFLAGVRAVDPDYEIPGDPAITLDDIARFRQVDSKAPGHPEYRLTSGVEATTGPLGQGVATSVGMAIAREWLAGRYNRDGHTLFDFDVFAICGDGDMMEGVSGEAASLAGHLRLDGLCWLYDNNRITIEGHTDLAFSEDVAVRFLGYGWNVLRVGDANDRERIAGALETFRATGDRPTLIVVDSHIAWGSPHVQDSEKAHGEPLGEDEVRATKRFYGWPEDEHFHVPDGVAEHVASRVGGRGGGLRRAWEQRFEAFRGEHGELADEIERMQRRELPDGWDDGLAEYAADEKGMATRASSGEVLNVLAQNVPWLLGGAADLFPSTKTRLTCRGAGDFSPAERGRNLHFGIREHAMGAVLNGMSLVKVRPFGATFLTFSDYERGALRLSALMELPVVQVFTHDSIGLGEDGPTHQPVEQLASLRAIPGLVDMRPADANEVVEAWRTIIQLRHSPVALVLSRQNLPTLDRSRYASAAGVGRGAYVLADPPEVEPEVILIGTGSEVSLCVAAHEELAGEGVRARVVSMPSWELFERQSAEYRDEVLPPGISARVAVEEASALGWERYAGPGGTIVAMHTFGASAPLKDLAGKFGFTPDAVVAAARALVERGAGA